MHSPGSDRSDLKSCALASLIVCCIALAVFFSSHAYSQAIVQARLSSEKISIDDSVTLSVTTNSESDSIDFSELQKDFEVIARSNSQQVQIANGVQQRIQTWVLELVPKAPGVYTIPGISIGKDKSNPLQITVTDANLGGERVLFLTAEVDKSTVYVQEQVILTIKVYEAVQIFDQQVTSLRHDDLVIHNVGAESTSEEVVDGRRYRVRSQKFAVFPQKSGEVEIPPLLMTASIPKDANAVQGFFRESKWIKRRTPAVTLDVLPRPDAQVVQWWLPAKQVELSNRWTPASAVQSVTAPVETGNVVNVPSNENSDDNTAQLSANNSGSATLKVNIDQPITRVIKLVGEGVSANQFPEIKLPSVEGLNLYAEDVSAVSREAAHGITSIQDITWAIIPQRPGTYELPEVRVEWFDTDLGEIQLAVLPPQTIEVIGDMLDSVVSVENTDGNAIDSTLVEQDTAAQSQPLETQSVEPAEDLTTTNVSTAAPDSGGFGIWKGIALASMVGWLLSVVALAVLWKRWREGFSTREAAATATATAVPSVNAHQSIQSLRHAIKSQSASDVLLELLNWGQAVWPENPPRHLNAIGSRLPSPQLDSMLKQLDAELYRPGSDSSSWSALATLPEELEQALKKHSQRASAAQPTTDALPSL